MTDLINRVDEWIKTDINGLQEIVNKYADVLKDVLPEKNVPYVAVIINSCVHFLNETYPDLDADWKAWSVLLIKKMFEENKLEKEADIHLTIIEFLEYKDAEYEKYCKNIVSVSDYERDRGFFYRFFWKKTGQLKMPQ